MAKNLQVIFISLEISNFEFTIFLPKGPKKLSSEFSEKNSEVSIWEHKYNKRLLHCENIIKVLFGSTHGQSFLQKTQFSLRNFSTVI